MLQLSEMSVNLEMNPCSPAKHYQYAYVRYTIWPIYRSEKNTEPS